MHGFPRPVHVMQWMEEGDEIRDGGVGKGNEVDGRDLGGWFSEVSKFGGFWLSFGRKRGTFSQRTALAGVVSMKSQKVPVNPLNALKNRQKRHRMSFSTHELSLLVPSFFLPSTPSGMSYCVCPLVIV